LRYAHSLEDEFIVVGGSQGGAIFFSNVGQALDFRARDQRSAGYFYQLDLTSLREIVECGFPDAQFRASVGYSVCVSSSTPAVVLRPGFLAIIVSPSVAFALIHLKISARSVSPQAFKWGRQ